MWSLFVIAADTLLFQIPSAFQTVDRVPMMVEARFYDGSLDTTLNGAVSLQLLEGGVPQGTQYYTPLSLVMQRGVAQGTLQVYRAGQYNVVATVPGGLSDTSSILDVSPGPYTDVLTLFPGEILDGGYPGWRRVGNPAPDRYAVDDTVRLAILFVDPYGNPVNTQDSLDLMPFNSSGNGGLAEVMGGPVWTAGESLQVRPRVADPAFGIVVRSRTIPAEDTSSTVEAFPSSAQRIVLILPGETLFPGDTSGVGKTGSPQVQTVNVPFSADLILTDSLFNPVTITDPFGPHTMHIEIYPVSSVGQVQPAQANFGSQNTLTFQVSFSQQGTWGLEGVDVDSPTVRSGVTLVNVRLLADTLWVVPSADTVLPGSWETLQVHVEAAGGVPVPAAQVDARLEGAGSLLGTVGTTDSSGVARFYYQAPLTLGMEFARIIVQHGGFQDTAQLWTLALRDSVLLVYPNPVTMPPGQMNVMIWIPAVQDVGYAELILYDLTGAVAWRRVLQSGELTPGARQIITWDGRTDGGRRIAQGPYVLMYRVIGSGGRVIVAAKQRVGVVW